jgi:hypothetical protein
VHLKADKHIALLKQSREETQVIDAKKSIQEFYVHPSVARTEVYGEKFMVPIYEPFPRMGRT